MSGPSGAGYPLHSISCQIRQRQGQKPHYPRLMKTYNPTGATVSIAPPYILWLLNSFSRPAPRKGETIPWRPHYRPSHLRLQTLRTDRSQ